MGIRTVRLDKNTEKLLETIISDTGLSISSAIKKGLNELYKNIKHEKAIPYQIYSTLDIGKGRKSIPPSTRSKMAVKKTILLKHSQKKHKKQ